MYTDKNLVCMDCSQEFVFTARDQEFYAERGFTEPRRCPADSGLGSPGAHRLTIGRDDESRGIKDGWLCP